MIKLTHGSTTTLVNEQGAWVEELHAGRQPILFPKTQLMSDSGEAKTRGGMHVCLPNFGPGGASGLAQHGFGRVLPWRIVSQNASSVELALDGPAPIYSGMVATLRYDLERNALTATLIIRNDGRIPFRIAPGFHPYFHLDDSETAVSINNTVYELTSLSSTEFTQAEAIELRTAGYTVTVTQKNLSTWAIWTDSLAGYVCVEPTLGGYRFLESPTPEEKLTPNTSKTFSCNISWQ